ncbi:MAG: ATP-binding protein [Phycisphaerales bacterium]|nr:ATP-binding protein [Phycisphaerales bacterium]
MIDRIDATARIHAALRRAQIVLLLGPRQCGKTTLARTFVASDSSAYFDLESPDALARMSQPMTALTPLRGTVVIDEVQRLPDLFPLLRVLADRKPLPARFLVLGSASPELLRQSSESLAGRVEIVQLGSFTLAECGAGRLDKRWSRGGFPRAFLARNADDSTTWMTNFISTLIERDLPFYDARLAPGLVRRMWTMFAHYHGQTTNYSSIASSLGTPTSTVRHHLDLLTGLLVVRQIQPWFENIGKRQVKSPRLYFRDTGMLHSLLGIDSTKALLSHPRCGASWEGLVVEELLTRVPHSHAYWWSTQQGAEIDLVLFHKGKRFGVEVKRADAATVTPSIRIAKEALGLKQVTIVHPGEKNYPLAKGIKAVGIEEVIRDPACVLDD